MIFTKIFAYFELAAGAIGAAGAIIQLVQGGTVTGPALLAIVQPELAALQTVLPHAAIPPALLVDVTDAVADAIDAYYHPKGA